MDYHFPKQLFPSYYVSGCLKPNRESTGGGTCGSYDGLIPQGGSGTSWSFSSRHQTTAETWQNTEPVPIPLFNPKTSRWSASQSQPLDIGEQMQNFYLDHHQDAFRCMTKLVGKGLAITSKREKIKDISHTPKILHKILSKPDKYKHNIHASASLLVDVVSDIPPELLGSLLHEELTHQGEESVFSEQATGGALAFIPFSECQSGSAQGCLLYPGGPGVDLLNFHKVALQRREDIPVLVTDGNPVSIKLKAPARQISCASLSSEHCVAVRSDHICGVWKYTENQDPCLLQVISTKEKACCISASPHVLGEVLVASEGGSAHLWTVGKSVQKVREESNNLNFNANSRWRWCEFSAHPRVVTYADRTGAELTDIRMTPASSQSLFGISRTSDCYPGERVIACRYLKDVHPFHHLITTQYSAYVVDERLPGVPMLKMDHMMESPPMFCHVSPGVGTNKVLLGSQSSQEITLLQYSGGRMEACSSRGPPQALLRPKDSLKHLPVQIPHRQVMAANRLSWSAAGLTCIKKPSGGTGSDDDCLCVLQLTEVGDIFYQTLTLKEADSSRRLCREDLSYAPQTQTQSLVRSESCPTVAETSSDEDIVGPTQPVHGAVDESSSDSDASLEESQSRKRRRRNLKGLKRLKVVVNVEPDLKPVREWKDEEEEKEKRDEEQSSDATSSHQNQTDSTKQQSPLKLSNIAVITWKRWLQKLVHRDPKIKKNRSESFQVEVKTMRLMKKLKRHKEELSKKPDLPSLKCELMECMTNQSLLVNGIIPSCPNKVVPFPEVVQTDQCKDELSERLTVFWQSQKGSKDSLSNQLDLSRKAKVDALKRKREKEKAAKRASGGSYSFSGSFTSSYPTDQDYLLDSFGWCSQRAWSDVDEPGPLSGGSEEPGSPPRSQGSRAASLFMSSTPHPQIVSSQKSPGRLARNLSLSQKSPGVSNLFGKGASPVKKPVGSLFADGSNRYSLNQVTETVTSRRTTSNTFTPGKFDMCAPQSPSNFWSFSQSSQSQMRPSQGTQPKRRSRMGF